MSPRSSLLQRLRRLAGDARGVSAVEFALILPLMITLYLGGSELAEGLAASRKVTLVSRTIADLTSQSSGLTAAQMTNILDASAAVISPFPSNKLKVTVSQLKIDKNGTVTVDWTKSLNGGAGSGGVPPVPEDLKIPDTYLIWSEAEYDYEPAIGYVVTGDLALKSQMYMRPRLSNYVTYPLQQ